MRIHRINYKQENNNKVNRYGGEYKVIINKMIGCYLYYDYVCSFCFST